MANQLAAFGGSVVAFVRDHLLAIRYLVTPNCIENIITLLKRLMVIWPSFLSLLAGVLLLTLSQVADLLARPLDLIELVVLVICLMFFWIVPLHLGGRILLSARRRKLGLTGRQDRLDVWLPKDLGFLAILALALTIWYQMHDYEVLTSYLDGKALPIPKYLLWAVPAACFLFFLIYLAVRERTNLKMSEEAGRTLAIGFTAVSALLVFVASMAPFPVARLFGGLLFFPMLVGGWLMPVVGGIMLANSTLFWRRIVQSGLVIVVVALGLSGASSDNPFHDIRLLPKEAKTSPQPAQMPIEAYIAQWKERNACAAEEQAGRRCRAVLIAAEGGASRAAFQVATVMGELLDDSSLPDIRDKLFLLSGVSGGSLGLATVRQALADSPDGRRPPCRETVDREARHWIYYGTDHAKEMTTSWRKCLQLLVSGDYLTPAMVGLTLRDWWMALPAMLDIGLDDRSALLERAMEKHYAAATGKDCEKFEGLCSPFGHVDRSRQWLPALILNSTLVERGQNVVVSDIDPASPFPASATCRDNAGRLYPAHLAYSEALPVSYDLYELMDAKRKLSDAQAGKTIRDISMSTAIVTSARFPVISSRGNIRNADGDLVGKLVDGGYFDNSGLASILDIIDALSCNNVDSIVISIRNNPTDENTHRLWSFPGRTNIRQPPLEMADSRINVAFSVLDAFLNSSSGHVLENRFSAMNRTGFDNFISGDIYKVICLGPSGKEGACSTDRVEIKSLSMSWWLSTYVQLFIEMQDGDTLLDQKCGEMHCRRRLTEMLAAALAKVDAPAVRTNERLEPYVKGLDSTIDIQRYAQ